MDEITSEQQNMMNLLANALWRSDINSMDTDTWPVVYEEMKDQAVCGLVADYVCELKLGAEDKKNYIKRVALNIQTFHNLMIEQDTVLKLLCDNGIKAAVIKGAAAAVYYPVPEYRQMGDIDIIVLPDDYNKAFDIMKVYGYINEQEFENTARHLGFQTESGIEIELHRCFSSSANTKQNRILDQFVYEGIENLEMHDTCGYSIPMLPSFSNGLVLLAHINQHLSEGLGLRQIIDWMMYVKQELSDQAWEQFSTAADAVGMKKLAETTTYMCKKYFKLSGISWCDQADEKLADELMEYILKNGNFGRKYNTGSRTTMTVMHRFNNPVTAIRYLTVGGMVHWKAAKKHQWLKPFAWIYQIGHLIRMGLKRKTSLSAISEEFKQSARETDFLQRLGVTNL